MRDYKELLKRKKILISDGAWGTELIKYGFRHGECPEKWNADRPEIIKKIAKTYSDAGSDIVLTNTFGSNRIKLNKSGMGDLTDELNRRGAALSRESVTDDCLVFASVGSTGEFVAPLGTISEKELIETFEEQVRGLISADIDGIAIETMSDLTEAKCALKAVRNNSDLPVVVSMTFNNGPKGFATIMGVKPIEASRELDSAGADIIGSNCGTGIHDFIQICKLLRSGSDKPVWIKPNAGVPKLVDGKTLFSETPEDMAEYFFQLAEAGASIIGGCCGTTPEYIRLIVKKKKKWVEWVEGESNPHSL